MPCALAHVSRLNEENKREIYALDVEYRKIERSNGVGSIVVKILRDTIYPQNKLWGYSVSEASRFWVRHASSYDKVIFKMYQDGHAKSDYDEWDLYDSPELMYFCL